MLHWSIHKRVFFDKADMPKVINKETSQCLFSCKNEWNGEDKCMISNPHIDAQLGELYKREVLLIYFHIRQDRHRTVKQHDHSPRQVFRCFWVGVNKIWPAGWMQTSTGPCYLATGLPTGPEIWLWKSGCHSTSIITAARAAAIHAAATRSTAEFEELLKNQGHLMASLFACQDRDFQIQYSPLTI